MQSDDSRIPIGISSCLLGEAVRYDGGHKFDNYINGTLAEYFRYVPVCPEMGIGLGVPRPTIRLVGDPETPRAVGVKDPTRDVSESLRDFARETIADLPAIRGYLLKRGSPSCGMERVKVYSDKGMPIGSASGLYAAELLKSRPLLPVEEEGRLGDTGLRENFLERVFIYDRWLTLQEQGVTPGALVDFHTRHKLILLAHDESRYRRLGPMVAEAGKADDFPALVDAYAAEMMACLKVHATPGRHANVLMHLMGYLKEALDGGDKAELLHAIDRYRCGEWSRIAPITLLNHHFRRHPHPYVADQLYLDPSLDRLMSL